MTQRMRVSFELERLALEGDELVVSGFWTGVQGMRFVRPTLLADDRRILATLEHKPWAPSENAKWTAAFPWTGGIAVDADSLSLAVAPKVIVPLGEAATGAPAVAEPAPPPDSARDQQPAPVSAAARQAAAAATPAPTAAATKRTPGRQDQRRVRVCARAARACGRRARGRAGPRARGRRSATVTGRAPSWPKPSRGATRRSAGRRRSRPNATRRSTRARSPRPRWPIPSPRSPRPRPYSPMPSPRSRMRRPSARSSSRSATRPSSPCGRCNASGRPSSRRPIATRRGEAKARRGRRSDEPLGVRTVPAVPRPGRTAVPAARVPAGLHAI